MGLKLSFVVKNTKQTGINQTFRDSSSRTSGLKKNAIDNLKKNQALVDKNLVDKNQVHHRVHLLRNSGGTPNSSRPARLTL